MFRFSKRLFIVNLLGALFYLGCLMQWMWALLPLMPSIIKFTELLQSPADDIPMKPIIPAYSFPSSPLVTLFGLIMVVVVVGIIIYLIVKAPTAIGKTGQKLTTSASNYIVPVVSHHKKLSPKKRRRLAARVIVYLKIALSVSPAVLGLCAYFIDTALSYNVIALVVGVLAVGTLITLLLQLSLMKVLKVAPEKVW